MSRTAKTVIVVAVALLATGICGGAWLLKARDLPGEVFLLAKDGTATRLALVEVSVYPRAQVEPYLAVLTNGLAEFALPVKEASSRWHEANEAYGKAVDAWELNLKKGDLDLTEKLKSDRFRRSSDEEFKKLMSLREQEFGIVSQAFDHILQYPGTCSAVTDADGKFNVRVPVPGDHVVVARGGRTGDDGKHCRDFWLFPLDKRAGKVVLSSGNWVCCDPNGSLVALP